MSTSDHPIEHRILDLLRQRKPESSICPSEVARALAPDEAAWRALMPEVRRVAADMADAGRIRITHGDQPVARAQIHDGPIRLRRGDRFD